MKRVTLRKADKSTIQGYLNEIDLLKRLAKHECIINLFDCEHNKERKTITMVSYTILISNLSIYEYLFCYCNLI
jgi:serine/threonine protein kinase